MGDALLLLSFGGPEGPQDVMPFLRNVTRGRNVPEERLAAVAEHYHHFGGVSPINGQNRALLERLERRLAEAGVGAPVYWGNRNWRPFVGDTMRQIADDGHARVIALATSAWSSYSGCRQYREDLAAAADGLTIDVCKVRPFHDHPGFIEAQADRVRAVLAVRDWPTPPRLVHVAHAIPTAMAEASTYVEQVRRAAERVTNRLGGRFVHDVAWCSRSGPPSVPWTEPELNDHLARLADAGERAVVVVPIGFVSDHMEVAWDLDVEARQTAEEHGLAFARAGSVGTHPAFVEALVDLWADALEERPDRARMAVGPGEPSCDAGCCVIAGAPERPVVPAC